MANNQTLKNAIAQVIKTNGNNEITGQLTQDALFSIINQLGAGSTFLGEAIPSTNPGVLDSNNFYLASTAGVYPNFGGLSIPVGQLYIVNNKSGSWVGTSLTPFAPDLKPTKNLFNVKARQVDKHQPSSVSNVATAIGWECSNYIPVEVGKTYSISGNKNRVGVGFYDANFNCVRYFGINTGSVTIQSGERYVVFNLKSDVSGNYSNVQFEEGAATVYEPFGYIITRDSVEGVNEAILNSENAIDLAQTAIDETNEVKTKIDAFDISKSSSQNLFNPNVPPVLVGHLLEHSSGNTTTAGVSNMYNTSDYMPVLPNTQYRVLNISGSTYARKVCFYNASKVFISGGDNPGTSIATPANAAFVRISVANATPMVDYGFFQGTNPSWEPYSGAYIVKLNDDNTPTDDKGDDWVATIKDVKSIAAQTAIDETNLVQYSLDASGNIVVTYPIGVINAKIKSNRGFGGNNMFNFTSYNINGYSKSNGDDVAPIHALNTTIGANHGQPMYNATINSHGLTNADVGTEWLNGSGTKFYVIRIVDVNTVSFLSQNNGSALSPNFVALSSGVLTKGAETLNVSAVVGTQLYPSIKNLQTKVLVNGVDEIETGVGNVEFLDIVESYDIMSVDGILQNLISNVGNVNPPVYNGDSFVTVKNIYRFVPGGAVIVLVNVKGNYPIAFADIMATQAVTVGVNGQTHYYVPNSNPIGSLDFRTPLIVTWSNAIPSTYFSNANQPDPQNPPNRVVTYYEPNNLGFSIGYLKNMGVGKELNTYTARTFELRNNTGKIYPHPVEGTRVGSPLPVNSMFDIAMFRVFSDLSKTRVGNRLSYFNFSYLGKEYVYIDYSGTMLDLLNIEKSSLNGKSINIVESKNTTLKTEIYNDGFVVDANYISGETCYIVLTIG